MTKKIKHTLLTSLCLLLFSAVYAQDSFVTTDINVAGERLYEEACANCHAMPVETKSPPLATLKQMGPRAVRYALTNGKMRVQAQGLIEDDINNLVAYLSATADVDNSWITQHLCQVNALAGYP